MKTFLSKVKTAWDMLYAELAPRMVFVFIIASFGSLLYTTSERTEKKYNSIILAKDKEIKQLREDIQIYLTIDGVYDMPAKDALPILQKFGLAKE